MTNTPPIVRRATTRALAKWFIQPPMRYASLSSALVTRGTQARKRLDTLSRV